MLKHLISVLVSLFACSMPACACDLSPEQRSNRVADYVSAALPCLAALPDGYVTDTAIERGFLDRINAERTQRGLTPLSHRPELLNGARFHSLDMAKNDFFNHIGPDKRSAFDRISAFDRRALYEFASENIAKLELVQGTADLNVMALETLHQKLMQSPPHRKNILHPDATHVAIGVIQAVDGVWVTQNFLQLSGTLGEDAPLHVSAGETVDLSANITEWTFKAFETRQKDRPTKVFKPVGKQHQTPDDLTGDFQLFARSERKGESPRVTYSIQFAGPSISTRH